MVLSHLVLLKFYGGVSDASGGGGAAAETTVIYRGSRNVVIRYVNGNTAAGEVNSTLLNKSSFLGPDGTAPGRLVIERVQWNIFGSGTVIISFDHANDDNAVVLSGEGDHKYPDGGIVDPVSAGGNGNLLISATPSVGGKYDVTVTVRMKD